MVLVLNSMYRLESAAVYVMNCSGSPAEGVEGSRIAGVAVFISDFSPNLKKNIFRHCLLSTYFCASSPYRFQAAVFFCVFHEPS